jgi:hypothetical protein
MTHLTSRRSRWASANAYRPDPVEMLHRSWANAVPAPRHSGSAPSRKRVSAIRRVSAFAAQLVRGVL